MNFHPCRVRKRRPRRGQIDYNAEIPFEKKPAAGFHDTSQEEFNPEAPNFKRMRQHELDDKRRDEEEEVCRS